MQRRSFLTVLGFSLLGACPRPMPGPDAGSTTPSGVMSVIDSVFGILGGVLPILMPFVQRFIPDGPAKAVVIQAAEVVARVGREWQSVAATFRERGGDSCLLYAVTGALTDALVRLARALVDAGFGWGQEISTLLDDLGLLLDRLIGRCSDSIDAGRLTATGRSGEVVRAELEALRASARARGTGLRTLPPMDASSLR